MVEQFQILLLKGQCALGLYPVSSGGVTSTVVDPRLCFAAALKANATSIVMAHNHPSGNLVPSLADKEITTRMKAGGELLEIKVLDHLIISRQGYYSFADGDFTRVQDSMGMPKAADTQPRPE